MRNRPTRNTGRAIVIRGEEILLMERWRGRLHYFSIPGGGIEPGESPAQTAVREVAEETSVKIKPGRLIYEMRDGPSAHYFFLADYQSGEPELRPDSEEASRQAAGNRYKPRWVGLKDVPDLPFLFWQPIHGRLMSDLQNGFPTEPVIIDARAHADEV